MIDKPCKKLHWLRSQAHHKLQYYGNDHHQELDCIDINSYTIIEPGWQNTLHQVFIFIYLIEIIMNAHIMVNKSKTNEEKDSNSREL